MLTEIAGRCAVMLGALLVRMERVSGFARGGQDAVSTAVDGGHALVAVNAQGSGLGIGPDAMEQVGLA